MITGQWLPLSVKAIVVQIEMSSTKTTKDKGPATDDIYDRVPPLAHNKSGRFIQ